MLLDQAYTGETDPARVAAARSIAVEVAAEHGHHNIVTMGKAMDAWDELWLT